MELDRMQQPLNNYRKVYWFRNQSTLDIRVMVIRACVSLFFCRFFVLLDFFMQRRILFRLELQILVILIFDTQHPLAAGYFLAILRDKELFY